MSKWIPCNERLPEEDGEYLVTYQKEYAEEYGFSLIGIAPFEVDCESFGTWAARYDPILFGYVDSDWREIPVEAWIPLPEPYKEAENSEEEPTPQEYEKWLFREPKGASK